LLDNFKKYYIKKAIFWGVTGVALVRTDVWGDPISSISRVKRRSDLATTLAVTSK
jgi:hypothetical protein